MGLTACSSNLIYKPEVVQGNFVSREQVQALRPGMPRQAVRDVLGTPLVTSLFHANRWDYAFTIRRQGSEPQQRRFSVFFKNDVLERIEGDPLPTEAEFTAAATADRTRSASSSEGLPLTLIPRATRTLRTTGPETTISAPAAPYPGYVVSSSRSPLTIRAASPTKPVA